MVKPNLKCNDIAGLSQKRCGPVYVPSVITLLILKRNETLDCVLHIFMFQNKFQYLSDFLSWKLC